MEARKLKLVESPAEQRGKLAAEEPGEMVFGSQLAAVEAMQARIRSSRVKYKQLAEEGEIKSPSTVSNMASGKTHWPRFSTMFGIAAALDLEVVYRPRKK